MRLKVKVPQGYDDVTIKQWHEIRKMQARDMDKVTRMCHTISILCNLKYDQVIALPLTHIGRLFAELDFIGSEVGVTELKTTFKCGPYFYSLVNLDEVTAGQYTAVKELCQNYEDSLHNIMACFVLKTGEKFTDKSFKENSEILYNHLSIQMANNISVFFCRIFNESSQAIQAYLIQEAKSQIDSAIHHLQTTTDGV